MSSTDFLETQSPAQRERTLNLREYKKNPSKCKTCGAKLRYGNRDEEYCDTHYQPPSILGTARTGRPKEPYNMEAAIREKGKYLLPHGRVWCFALRPLLDERSLRYRDLLSALTETTMTITSLRDYASLCCSAPANRAKAIARALDVSLAVLTAEELQEELLGDV